MICKEEFEKVFEPMTRILEELVKKTKDHEKRISDLEQKLKTKGEIK